MFSENDRLFFRQWLRNPLRIGALAPSSRELAEAMARLVPMPLAGPVIELGGGTGPVTAALLESGVPPDQLYVVERDPALHHHLTRRFPAAKVIRGDAAELTRILRPLGVHDAGAIVSGLPMLSIKRSVQRAIIDEGFALLAPGAPFIQFTYGLFSPIPRRAFGVVGRVEEAVLGNLPPARIWVYRRPADGHRRDREGRRAADRGSPEPGRAAHPG